MGYSHYSTEEIFVAHGDDEIEVEPEILRETGVGGDFNDEKHKKGWDVSLRQVIVQRGEEE